MALLPIGPKHDAYSTEYRCPDKSFQFNLYYSGYEAGVPFFICNFCQTEAADKRKLVVACSLMDCGNVMFAALKFMLQSNSIDNPVCRQSVPKFVQKFVSLFLKTSVCEFRWKAES